MAEPKQKLVKVDDSIIAFPDAMPDEHVATVIKSFRAKKNPQPLATEESEHARQLKPAQPLETAIPSLPQWANTPVLSGLTFDAQIERAEKSGHTEQAEWLRKQKALQDKAYQKNIEKHPIATGVGEGVGETAEGLTTPANLALMITAPESKIMSGLFAIQSLHGSYKDVEEARRAYREGRNAEASKYATQAILNLGIAGLAGHHAVKDIPVPEPVKAFMKDETGSVGPQGKVAPAKPDSKTESEPGYAYHATNIDRLEEIANSGKLKIYGPSYGTDQSMWPDRSTSKRAYFTPNAGSAWQFSPEEGRPVIVRTKSAGLKKEGTGDLYSETPVGVQNLEYLGEDKQWHPVQKMATPDAGNRTYYRGQNPESTEKIKTGDDYWDSLLFVADEPKHASNYGRNIDKVQLRPDAQILREGTPQFRKVVGPYKKGESMLQFSSRAAKAAQAAGYDAVHFQLQGTVGTAILNRNAVESSAPHNYTPKLADVKAKAAELKPTTAYKSVDQSQPFYLKSENLITEKMKGPMPAEDVHKMLLSNGVKPEEMKWTGLDELLQGKGKQKVTPQEIQEHLAGNNLQVQEVVKGGPRKQQIDAWKQQADREATQAANAADNGDDLLARTHWDTYHRLMNRVASFTDSSQQPKFGSYVLPGGENYRELLVTMPPKNTMPSFEEWSKANGYGDHEGARNLYERIRSGEARDTTGNANQFRSSHWDEPNVLGHVRFNDRTGPNGERILHIEEAQSDWGQRGRDVGFNNPARKALNERVRELTAQIQKSQAGEVYTPEAKKETERLWEERRKLQEGIKGEAVPDMPFKKNWHELLLKRMMKYAAENGYDGISWTPGDLQAERYDLSKQVDAIHYRSAGPRMFSVEAYRQGIGTVLSQTGTPEELEEVVGKDIVRKMIAGEGNEVGGPGNFRKLTGVDLKVGGEGMKGFYDKIIPDAANKLGKQWGAKVGDVDLGGKKYTIERSPDLMRYRVVDQNGRTQGGRGIFFSDKAEAEKAAAAMQAEEPPMKVPYLPITPQMRAGVKSIPYSLFSIPLAAGALTLQQVKAQGDELQKKFKPTGVTK